MLRLTTLLCLLGLVPTANGQCGVQRVLPEVAKQRSRFGYDVALSGDRAVVGTSLAGTTSAAQDGRAYVYERAAGRWTSTALLEASDHELLDLFGWAVAVDGDTIVVGAPRDDDADPTAHDCSSGSIYVFTWDGTRWREQKIVASDQACGDNFGHSVAIEGDRVLVGAPWRDAGGAVYVFERTPTGWVEDSVLVASDSMPAILLGSSVALSRDTIVAGAPHAEIQGTRSGAGYVFQYVGHGWVQAAKLGRQQGGASDSFGFKVDVDGDTAVIARLSDLGVLPGAVHVFDRNGWQESAELIGTGIEAGDYFGRGLAIEGDRILVGAPQLDVRACATPPSYCDQGAVFVFELTWGVWRERRRITGFDGESPAFFGASVAIDAGSILVGAPHVRGEAWEEGAAYFYDEPGFVRHCTSSAAVLVAEGCGSVGANDLELVAAPVPDTFGFFAYASAPGQAPFGNGYMCLTGPRHHLAATHAVAGVLRHAVDVTVPPTPAATIVVGAEWSFQAFFRDPAAGGASFDSSDALAITFVP